VYSVHFIVTLLAHSNSTFQPGFPTLYLCVNRTTDLHLGISGANYGWPHCEVCTPLHIQLNPKACFHSRHSSTHVCLHPHSRTLMLSISSVALTFSQIFKLFVNPCTSILTAASYISHASLFGLIRFNV
jgi:hypothetical protein